LSAEGYPVFRFDQRGWGDSYGEFHDFDAIADDIRAAIDTFMLEEPSLEEVVLWGECNAASAILFYAHRDPRVRGLALQNPWARSEQGQARTILRHYYLMRLKQPEFWQKLLKFRFNPLESLRSLFKLVVRSRSTEQNVVSTASDSASEQSLPEKMFSGFRLFKGRVMLVLSSQDIIAHEFDEAVRANPAWSKLLASGSYRRIDMADGDHTFSSAEQRNKVVSWAISWMASW
jgi:exosortase A-associated hydrolase 1